VNRVSSATISVAGVRSPVLQAGPADSTEAVVFVHGTPGAGRDWSELMEPVSAFARCIAPDMPGFGGADKPKDFAYTVEGYARHLGGLLDELGVTRAHVVLHDFGGSWGLAWAIAHPQALASVTLINTGVLIDYSWHKYARVWRTPVAGELLQASTSRFGFRQLAGRENPGLSRAQIDRIFDAGKPRATKYATRQLFRATDSAAGEQMLSAPLREIDPPALVIWGSDDRYVPVEQAERQRASLPRARVEILEGRGHWPFWEDPAAVAELVVGFLRPQLAAR
jgi:pimeloyl-ACP methyl ester carboxylesterase